MVLTRVELADFALVRGVGVVDGDLLLGVVVAAVAAELEGVGAVGELG